MATKFESDYPTSPTNDESEDEGPDSVSSGFQEEIEDQKLRKPANNVANVLKKLHSLGAIVKKPKEEYRCYTCVEDFPNWEELENHLIQHVSLPSVVLDKLPSDDEETIPSGDERWSDEEETQTGSKPDAKMAGQKIDISQILKKSGISIKKPVENKPSNSDSALSKLSGLGFTIKKNLVPIKTEKPEPEQQNAHDVMQKLGKLGGIKLTLKSDGNNTNTFKVINGLKDFKTSDDEDEGSGNEGSKDDPEGEMEEDQEKQDGSEGEQDFVDEQNISEKRKNSESDGSEKGSPLINKKIINAPKSVQGKIIPKLEPVKTPMKPLLTKPPQQQQPIKPPGRPVVKQTPKRGANLPITVRESLQQVKEAPTQGSEITTSSSTPSRASSTPERRESHDTNTENIVVKQEVDSGVGLQSSSMPLFSNQIKTERYSPPSTDSSSTPIIAKVKTEPDVMPTSSQPILNQVPSSTSAAIPLLPVTKKEDTNMTIIEINGDSNDEDDDCCVVSATPAPDVKPVVPKTEAAPSSYPPPASFPSSQSSYSSAPVLSSRMPTTPSTEKQHNFNWNAPDSKPAIDILEKSADDIFESLLSSATKKENNMSSISEVSEYISLDTLGPQHSCDVCNTRFTDIMLLEEHKIATGHSKTLVAPSSSTLLPYNPSSSNILSSLLPVKQLAEQVGKLSGMGGSGPGFTHQQNVMINIQAYPGGSGVMVQPPPYPSYPPGQNMHHGFPQGAPNNMFGAPGQPMSGQYPGQNYMGQQFQSPMSKAGYPGAMPPNSYSTASISSPYSSASPLQGMQQSVYGQSSTGFSSSQQQMGQMGPPGSSPSHPYAPASSPGGSMKPPTSGTGGIRIQNVQTFPPGQLLGANGQPIPTGAQVLPGQQIAPGQVTAPGAVGGQLPSPSQIRMAAGANVAGPRPRMASVRGARPSIRPGIQVHGQVRGAKPGPRMPMKRPAGIMGGPGQKRRPDVLLPGKHDNEDCQVMSMQKQRDGVPMIQSVQGAKDRLNLGSQISITKKTVNKEANAMANVLASRGISVKQKQKSRSPTPERPVPHIPNLGAGVSIKHTSKSSNFSIPEAKVGGGMLSCKICKKMFMNHNSLSVHMFNAHPQNKIPVFKCDECPASYPKSLQLQHHKRVFHNVSGPNRELGLPVVDLSQEENLKRLSNLGIHSFIPLANREQASGCFGIPVISVHNAQNGMTNSLQALGADGLLSLGPLKPLPNS